MVAFSHSLVGRITMIRGQAVVVGGVVSKPKRKSKGMTNKEFLRFLAELQLDALDCAEPLEVTIDDFRTDDDAELTEYVGLLELAESIR